MSVKLGRLEIRLQAGRPATQRHACQRRTSANSQRTALDGSRSDAPRVAALALRPGTTVRCGFEALRARIRNACANARVLLLRAMGEGAVELRPLLPRVGERAAGEDLPVGRGGLFTPKNDPFSNMKSVRRGDRLRALRLGDVRAGDVDASGGRVSMYASPFSSPSDEA